MCSAMLLTACGNTSDSSTTKQTNATKQEQVEKKDQGDLNKVKTTKTLEITPTKVADVVSPEENKKGNKIIKIHYKIKNISNKDLVVAANDFIINIGENYYYMGSGINFAETIKPSKTVEGDGYYEIPKDYNKFKLMYQPLSNDERAAWNIVMAEDK
ncbi:hypothetical protein PWEIH_09096 [Listeria weihenstephanensis FSL R9-0317]|uniref:DUF4352 domain-containing protein n=2 Tax=Listeria weihenstephanensis TaxID=1006155 RepID=A0A1S7FX61_9LIST|nr:DUF4352 domain-containing protein [Listeria weihenstephanensis]AQY52034.1 hypothetical protein UE46_14090 [Listeria weihenstephanensis]EUJ38769.1 hypothetical protein PWEIH_09096 [Listeria weihenstephanensis FSL R9-0317]MBC1501694.1 DUF4352 domain-containing protein [Listeria weihenstephanensis]